MSRADRAEVPRPARRALVVPTLLALGAIALLLYLGTWQLARDAERNRDWRAAQEDTERPVLRGDALAGSGERVMWRRMHATVVFSDAPMLLSGASEDHRPGFRVMQVGTLEGGKRVLVDRGFLAHAGVEDAVNAFAPDRRQVVLTGRVRPLTDSADEAPYPRKRGCATVWPPHSRASMAPQGWYIHTGKAQLHYDWTSLHYAVQWFGMATLLLAGWAVWLWRKLGRRLPWTAAEPAAEAQTLACNLNTKRTRRAQSPGRSR